MPGAGHVDVNVEQARAWDGPDGDNWTDNEDWYNAAARFLTPPLFTAAAIAPGEHVLDVGCGTGETTRLAARSASGGAAMGVDLSTQMIERARQKAQLEGLANVRFERGDAQVFPFERSRFEVVISRFGSMFFDDPIAAFTNVASAMRTDGRLLMLCWREIARNEWVREMRSALASGRDLPEPPPNAPSPFAFADADRVREILGSAGFVRVTLDALEQPMYFGPDAESAFAGATKLGIVNALLADLDEKRREEALDRLRETLERHQAPEGILLGTSTWVVRAFKA